MGVCVSKANLAVAVANQGCAGVIASVGLANYQASMNEDLVKLSDQALTNEIRKARGATKGVIGVNVMGALSNYEQLAKVCAKEKVDLIISGAGLPMKLPAYTAGSDVKLIPVVSSQRTLKIICKKWKKDFDRLPDAVIVEGMQAGGHLGYSLEQLKENTPTLDESLADILRFTKELPKKVPVIVAGGIFSGQEMAHYINAGADGVQMATRFVCTDECDVDIKFKQAYINARGPEDITIIKSPVGLPGRVIKNEFVEKTNNGHKIPFKCKYRCLKTCNPTEAPYCIADVLARAARGDLENAFAFAGSNAWRCTEIIPVEMLINKIMKEYQQAEIDQNAGSVPATPGK
jgi:nitronate monooxygenase